MQFAKLSDQQKKMKHWRAKRNRLVQKLLDDDKRITRADALKKANAIMGRMPS